MTKLYCGTYCLNRLDEIKTLIKHVWDYVDEIIIIDGGSVDGTIPYLRNLEKNTKVRLVVVPWENDYGKQQNAILNIVPIGEWVLGLDSDELPTKESLEQLRTLIEDPKYVGYHFYSIDRVYKGDGLIHESGKQREYGKHLLLKNIEGMRYNGKPHQGLFHPDKDKICKDKDLNYYHYKQELVIWERGMRNFLQGGTAQLNDKIKEKFEEFKQVWRNCVIWNLNDWELVQRYFARGMLHPDLRKWILDHRNYENGYLSSEVQELFKTYFLIYHPDQLPLELRKEYKEYLPARYQQ